MPESTPRRELARRVRTLTIQQLHDELAAADITRAFIVYENGEFQVSHPEVLEPLAALIEYSQDFAGHEGIFIGREEGVSSLFFAFVHDTRRGLAQGGLRFWKYDSVASLLEDGMRLSHGMTRKNALAGLHWGGGKGIATVPPGYERPDLFSDRDARDRLFEGYGRFVASLGGVYYTAEDIGTNTPDMDAILRCNRFTTCISPAKGGSGNPSAHTALGVFIAMTAAWDYLHGTSDLSGVSVAVQGAGNVGRPLIDLLVEAGATVTASDPNPSAIDSLRRDLPTVDVVEPDAIFDVEADVFAPCAIGAQVNADTIPRLKVELVCGAANNQLAEPADAERLRERGITYVPDYLCNRMGIVNCADEWAGYIHEDVEQAAERVYPDTIRVLEWAAESNVTTAEAADAIADAAAAELHPLLGHRGRRLIDHFMARVTGSERSPGPHFYEPHRDDHRHWARERRELAGETPDSFVPGDPERETIDANTLPLLVADVEARERGDKPHADGVAIPVLAIHEREASTRDDLNLEMQVAARALHSRENATEEHPDEERFDVEWCSEAMSSDRGTTVSLRSLVERFGTDAVRLALLLMLDEEKTLLRQRDLRRADTTVQRLIAAASEMRAGRSPDESTVSEIVSTSDSARRLLQQGHVREAAESLVKLGETLGAASYSSSNDVSSLAEAIVRYEPIIPFLAASLSNRLGSS